MVLRPFLLALKGLSRHVIDNLNDDQTLHDLFPPARFPGVAQLLDPFDDNLDDRGLPAPPRADSPPRRRRRRLQVVNVADPNVIAIEDHDDDIE